jgi:hypothetical protein
LQDDLSYKAKTPAPLLAQGVDYAFIYRSYENIISLRRHDPDQVMSVNATCISQAFAPADS